MYMDIKGSYTLTLKNLIDSKVEPIHVNRKIQKLKLS